MALVSYECSDSSDNEDDVENNMNIIEKSLPSEENKIHSQELEDNLKKKDSLFPPLDIKTNFNVVSWSLFTKNRTQPIKISVPSLDDEQGEEERKPKLKPSSKKSGLFAILPKPKQQLLVPASLSAKPQEQKKEPIFNRKKNTSSVLQNSASKCMAKGGVVSPISLSRKNLQNNLQIAEADDDDDGEQPKSFFFLTEQKEIEDSKVDIELNNDFSPLHSFDKNSAPSTLVAADNSTNALNEDMQPEFSETASEIALDKDALEKLCGRRGKRLAGEVEMVDVSGAELVGDSKLWLTKELTSQKVHYKRAKFDPVQKRKHQITYLASYAREQELELSNQWASNRMTKKQTQAKYGF